MYHIWFIGDQFFHEAFPALQLLRHHAKLQQTEQPYVYDYYIDIFMVSTLWFHPVPSTQLEES